MKYKTVHEPAVDQQYLFSVCTFKLDNAVCMEVLMNPKTAKTLNFMCYDEQDGRVIFGAHHD